MANNFKIEVPITVSDKGGGISIGDKIAGQIKKSLGAIGMGKSGGGGIAAKTGLKMAGILGAILAVISSISFIIKPVMSLLKAILLLLFLPLIPLLKPVLQLLQKFIEGQKKAIDTAPQIGKTGEPIIDAVVTIANWALMVGAMIGEFLTYLGQVAVELGMRIGQWLYDKIIEPIGEWIASLIIVAGEFIAKQMLAVWGALKDVGLWIWTRILEPAWSFLKDVGMWIWEIIKSPFEWLASKVRSIVDWFGSLGGKVGKFLGFAQGGVVPGAIGQPQLAVVHGGEEVIPVGGSGRSIVININHPSIREDYDIKKLTNEISRALQRQMSGRIASG